MKVLVFWIFFPLILAWIWCRVLSLGGVSLIVSHLIINSLKHRRSLLWWRKSFGSAGISFRKTWATSNGPCNGGQREEERDKTQRGRVRETKKEKAKNKAEEGKRGGEGGSVWERMNKGGDKNAPHPDRGGNDFLTECLMKLEAKMLN